MKSACNSPHRIDTVSPKTRTKGCSVCRARLLAYIIELHESPAMIIFPPPDPSSCGARIRLSSLPALMSYPFMASTALFFRPDRPA